MEAHLARLSPAAACGRLPVVAEPPRPHGVVVVRVSRCKGCELCIEHCPVRVLELSADFNDGGYHYPVVARAGCINCQACSTICPEYAIFAVPAESLDRAGSGLAA
jgi:2-oxoglutarate ferredoxin oxidoreductase subunit delta